MILRHYFNRLQHGLCGVGTNQQLGGFRTSLCFDVADFMSLCSSQLALMPPVLLYHRCSTYRFAGRTVFHVILGMTRTSSFIEHQMFPEIEPYPHWRC